MNQYSDEHDDEGSLNDDPALQASLLAELERVLASLNRSGDERTYPWLLPITGIAEMLQLLKEAPTGLGVDGLEHLLRERFGSLSALKRMQTDSGGAYV